MADPVRIYLDAIRTYDDEQAKARALMEQIATVANAMQYRLPDFLSLTYSLAVPGPGRRSSYARDDDRIDMRAWPTADQIRDRMTTWHEAFMQVRRTWSNVPQGDQQGLRKPPETLSPR
jgi:hypothetical protein